jgi:CRP-like cAMP-binding protein
VEELARLEASFHAVAEAESAAAAQAQARALVKPKPPDERPGMSGLSVRELRRRAEGAGASRVRIDDALDNDNPKAALVELVLALEQGTAPEKAVEPVDSEKNAEYATMLQRVPLLQSLTEDERRKIASCLNAIEFQDGDSIVTEGEAGDAMYILQTGEAQAFVRETSVMKYQSGDFFGELALRSNQPRAATVKASGFSTTVLQLPQEDFNWLMTRKEDIKAMIEQQANSYAKNGADAVAPEQQGSVPLSALVSNLQKLSENIAAESDTDEDSDEEEKSVVDARFEAGDAHTSAIAAN